MDCYPSDVDEAKPSTMVEARIAKFRKDNSAKIKPQTLENQHLTQLAKVASILI